MSSEEWLRSRGLSRLERRRLRGNLITPQIPEGQCGQGGAELFSPGSRNRTCGNVSKLHYGRIRMYIRKHFFTERLVKPWNRLLGEGVDAPSRSGFKRHLSMPLTCLI